MKANIYSPSSPQHKRLNKIASGNEHTSVSPENLGSLYQNDDLKELAWDYYHMEVGSRRDFEPYMIIQEPEQIDDHWIVRKFLTPVGQRALDAMEVGWFWDPQENCEAIEATFDFYRDLMAKGRFTVKHADWIVGNTDERFRPLRNEVVYFRMTAKRVGDTFVKLEDANE